MIKALSFFLSGALFFKNKHFVILCCDIKHVISVRFFIWHTIQLTCCILTHTYFWLAVPLQSEGNTWNAAPVCCALSVWVLTVCWRCADRRFSCSVRRDEMRTVFGDMAEDSEVRIAAYLGLMRCPSHREVGMIRTALEREQVNQGGYLQLLLQPNHGETCRYICTYVYIMHTSLYSISTSLVQKLQTTHLLPWRFAGWITVVSVTVFCTIYIFVLLVLFRCRLCREHLLGQFLLFPPVPFTWSRQHPLTSSSLYIPVGSFVWTHLKNLQETASPYQLEVQGLLADLHLHNKFNTDARKFSRNFEISGFNSEYHVGASLDSNLVYSSKSYIPRSLNSNLTLQMFGESVNLLEVSCQLVFKRKRSFVNVIYSQNPLSVNPRPAGGGRLNAPPPQIFRG